MISININTEFTVELTDKGLEIYLNYLKSFKIGNYCNTYVDGKIEKVKVDRILKEELWSLMQIFGSHLYNGCDIPFKNNIIEIKPYSR